MGLNLASIKNTVKSTEENDLSSVQELEDLHAQNAPRARKRSIDSASAEMVISHQELGLKIAWRLLSNWRIRLGQEDVRSIVGISLCEAASRFDPTKGASFGTFLFYHIRGTLLKEITNAVNERRFSVADSENELYHLLFNTAFYAKGDNPLIEHNTPERCFQQQELAAVLQKAFQKLDTLEQVVITRHFVNEDSLVNIARDLDYCRCHISRVKTSAIKKLGDHLLTVEAYATESFLKVKKATRKKAKTKYTGGRGRRKTTHMSDHALDEKKVA